MKNPLTEIYRMLMIISIYELASHTVFIVFDNEWTFKRVSHIFFWVAFTVASIVIFFIKRKKDRRENVQQTEIPDPKTVS